MKPTTFSEIQGKGARFYTLFGWLLVLAILGLGAAYYMEHNGHHVTGMNNQMVWGLPHVFAVFLIVSASGALNVASISSVFEVSEYKALAPLSALLSVALLAGGLIVLVLDLGRPDRLVVAMTHYNFKSIFAWNIFLYTGFFVVVGVYLWVMMEERLAPLKQRAGFIGLVWRLTLTTGTGSIFGFLVARQAYDEAIMAPMFIIMSFSFGLAIFLLVIMATFHWTGRPLGDYVICRLRNLLRVFVGGVIYFTVVQHLTNLYATEHHGIEAFILWNGGAITALFWIGQILIGNLVPLTILFHPAGQSRPLTALAATLIVVGGLVQVYVIIIGGQMFPLVLFPGMEVTSSFSDGMINAYSPSLPEFLLGVGGVALALMLVAVAVKVLPFLPESLSDEAVEPEYVAAKARREQAAKAKAAARA